MAPKKIEQLKALPDELNFGYYYTVKKRKRVSKIYSFVKRMSDIALSILALVLTSPIFLLIMFFYLFGESKGPVIFSQKRYGKNGSKFNIYKFRSMVVNADEKLRFNQILYEKYIKNNYKLEPNEDPRITIIGRFLRKTSLDELPQLVNVLKGEMSIVGPRPIVEEELGEYQHLKEDFLSVKPGITGHWQISGRSEVGYPERVDLELYYVYHQSLTLDLKIILKTFKIVFLKRGAY